MNQKEQWQVEFKDGSHGLLPLVLHHDKATCGRRNFTNVTEVPDQLTLSYPKEDDFRWVWPNQVEPLKGTDPFLWRDLKCEGPWEGHAARAWAPSKSREQEDMGASAIQSKEVNSAINWELGSRSFSSRSTRWEKLADTLTWACETLSRGPS